MKRNPLRLSVTKNGTEYSVDQLSDGEKCTLALLGDLARRMALANQDLPDPLAGQGVVLIDEIELHMHPSWQRIILPTLCKTFPNVQFIVTTHSPQILGEVNDTFNLIMLSTEEENQVAVETMERMDGFDSNCILKEYMKTRSKNPKFQKLLDRVTEAIENGQFNEAENLISVVRTIVGSNHSAVIELEGRRPDKI